jgi:hypothetical protein
LVDGLPGRDWNWAGYQAGRSIVEWRGGGRAIYDTTKCGGGLRVESVRGGVRVIF